MILKRRGSKRPKGIWAGIAGLINLRKMT